MESNPQMLRRMAVALWIGPQRTLDDTKTNRCNVICILKTVAPNIPLSKKGVQSTKGNIRGANEMRDKSPSFPEREATVFSICGSG